MRKYINVLGYLLAICSIVFLINRLAQHVEEIPCFEINIGSILSLIFIVILCAITHVFVSYMWLITLRGGNVFLNLIQTYVILGQSNIAKYLPGNIFHYIGQVALGRRFGIPPETIILSTGVLTVTGIMTAAIVAVIGFLFDNDAFQWLKKMLDTQRIIIIGSIIIGLVIILLIMIIVFPRFRSWIRPRLAYLRPTLIGKAVILWVIIFIIFGILISFLLNTIWNINTGLVWYQFSWGFALAWVLGLVVPGAPGGLGIREAIFFGLYRSQLGDGLVIGLAFAIRVITSLSDLLTFGIAYWLSHTGLSSSSSDHGNA